MKVNRATMFGSALGIFNCLARIVPARYSSVIDAVLIGADQSDVPAPQPGQQTLESHLVATAAFPIY